jgi:hypothetical protein
MSRRFTDKRGYNVSEAQFIEVVDMKHETLITPSQSQPVWGGQTLIDFKNKGNIVHDMGLAVQASPIGGLTGSVSNYPNYNPASQWFYNIDFLQNGQTQHTIYGTEQLLLVNLFNSDEIRAMVNAAQGDYRSLSGRNALATTVSTYYIDLWAYVQQTHIPLLTNGQEYQIRINWNPSANVINQSTLTGTPTSSLLSLNLLTKVSKLSANLIHSMERSLVSRVQHYKFLETRVQTYAINSGSVSASQILANFVGNVAYVMFVIRPVANINAGNSSFVFTPCQSFAILNAQGENIVGGQVIQSAMALNYLNKDWVKSTYTTETNSSVYIYSFCTDPAEAMNTGVPINTYRFSGSEQLQINFASAIGSNYQVDCYSYIESVIEVSSSGVFKKNL